MGQSAITWSNAPTLNLNHGNQVISMGGGGYVDIMKMVAAQKIKNSREIAYVIRINDWRKSLILSLGQHFVGS